MPLPSQDAHGQLKKSNWEGAAHEKYLRRSKGPEESGGVPVAAEPTRAACEIWAAEADEMEEGAGEYHIETEGRLPADICRHSARSTCGTQKLGVTASALSRGPRYQNLHLVGWMGAVDLH